MDAQRSQIELADGTRADRLDTVRALLREYEKDTGVSLCFQGFEQELATLPGRYAPPSGRLLLAMDATEAVGCIALRDITSDLARRGTAISGRACEMKRLYVRPSHRGRGIGRLLAERIIAEARTIGYAQMRLDTMHTMRAAVAMYRSLGFEPAERHNDDPDQRTLFFALRLDGASVPHRDAPRRA